MSHKYAIDILREAVARLTEEATEHESRAMRASAAKEAALNNIKTAEAAIDQLMKHPKVAYDPADGEVGTHRRRLAGLVPNARVRVTGHPDHEGKIGHIIEGGDGHYLKVRLVGRDRNVYEFLPRELEPFDYPPAKGEKIVAGNHYGFHRENDRWDRKVVRADTLLNGSGDWVISCADEPGIGRNAKAEELA